MIKDLHQVRVSDDKNDQNTGTSNNNQPNVRSSVQYRHSAELADSRTHRNSKTIYSAHRLNDNVQRNSYIPKTNLSQTQQQPQLDCHLNKPQRTINIFNSTELHNIPDTNTDIRNRKYQQHDYGNNQSNKDNRSYYAISSCNNGSCIGRNILDNPLTNNKTTTNSNHGLTNFTNRPDNQTRSTSSVKEQKSVHWSEDLDTSDSNQKHLANGVNTLNNNNKTITINFDANNNNNNNANNSITTAINNANTGTNNINGNHVNSYGIGYNTHVRRQKLPERDVFNQNVTKNYPCSKNIEEFLRRRSLSSNSANSLNQITRSQSLYAYLSMRNELANKANTNTLSNAANSIKPDDNQPKLPPKQSVVTTTCNTTTNTTTDNNSNHRKSDNYSEYSIARSVCSSVPHGVENVKSSNSVTTSQLPSNRRSMSPSFRRFSNQLETDAVVDKNQSSKTNLTIQIFLPDRTSKYVSVDSTTTALQVLQKLTKTTQKFLTVRHALVERIPVLHLERCLEDDECLLNYLSSWKIENENLIFFEERQDLYGLFESPKPHSTQQADSRLIIEMCAIDEDSWKKWYSLLRIVLVGKRLYTNYIVRKDTVKLYRENFPNSDHSSNRNSSCFFNSITDRPISSTISDLDSNDLHSINSNYKIHSTDIEFPPKSGSYSVSDLTKPIPTDKYMTSINNTHQNEASSLVNLTLYPIQKTSTEKSLDRQSRFDKRNMKSVKKRIFGNGPAARRCTRSISQISSPFNISLPYWIRASYEDRMNDTFNETVL
ncbi:unnamed protein product [Schistosoma turkestanicum]|nr:unnamed protein product [Schistosoma turkestanicum]